MLSLQLTCVLSFFIFSSTDSTPYFKFYEEILKLEELLVKINATIGDDNVALQMVDASTKMPSLPWSGALYDLGNFDQCCSIQKGNIFGKYCLGTIAMADLTAAYCKIFGICNQTTRISSYDLRYAVCVPNNWNISDIPGLVTYSEQSCYSKATEKKLSTGAIVTLATLSIFVALVLVSTAVDLHASFIRKSKCRWLLTTFSALTNGRHLFTWTRNRDQILCLNGIKSFSMMWIVLLHETFLPTIRRSATNRHDVSDFTEDPRNMFINNATLAVDTFFLVGGILNVYTYLKLISKGENLNLLMFYLHRYLRLTPVLAVLVFVQRYLFEYLGDGPLWQDAVTELVENCKGGWWHNLLYVSNYVGPQVCKGEAWYLSVDTQLFLLSPLILVPLGKRPKLALGALGILAVAGVIAPFVVAYTEDIGSLQSDPKNYINLYYFKTHTRFGPYIVGMILGYCIFQAKQSGFKRNLKQIQVIGLWLLSLSGLVVCLYAGHGFWSSEQNDKLANSFDLAFRREAWAAALAIIIFLCVAGYGGPVDWFLAQPIFQFLAKLSYAVYLVHILVISTRSGSSRTLFKFSHGSLMHVFWGDFMLSLVVSLALYLGVEYPLSVLQHRFLPRVSSKKADIEVKLNTYVSNPDNL